MRTLDSSAFASATDRGPNASAVLGSLRGDLLPTAPRLHLVRSDVATGQKLEGSFDLLLEVELRAVRLSEGFEPRWRDEIGDRHPVDVILEGFARTANFVGVKHSAVSIASLRGLLLIGHCRAPNAHRRHQVIYVPPCHIERSRDGRDVPRGAVELLP